MTQKRNITLDLAADIGMAGIHTGMTLLHRLPMLAAFFTPQGSAHHSGELNRMVSEKASATKNGAIDAQRVMMRLSFKTMVGRFGYTEMIDGPATVATAGMRPALSAVKANSARLSRH